MNLHPLCALFPPLRPAELQALADDISNHGLREPIVTLGGKILDGANRLRACERAGVEPQLEELPVGVDPVAFVISRNVSRRQLSTAQRALIGARLANLDEGRPGKTASAEAVSQPAAAARVGVSRTAVQQAAKIVERGVPELVEATTAGRIPLSVASQIATKSPKEQLRLVVEPRQRTVRAKRTPEAEAPPLATSASPRRGSAPQPLQSFAHRIESHLRGELDFAFAHELAGVGAWTPKERSDALKTLLGLRGELERLIVALQEVGDA